jgi:SAM-dependent methyltransferase
MMWKDWSEKQTNFLQWRNKNRKQRDKRSWTVFKEQFLKMVPVLNSNSTVLDVGCANGAFLKQVVNRCGCYGVGVDPYPLKADFPVVKAVAEYLPFRNGCFAFIFTTSSLDHFQSPGRFVSEVDLLLQENGCLMVMQGIENEDENDPTHLRSFSENSLLYLFRRFYLVAIKRVYAFAWLIPNWICRLLSPIYGRAVLIIVMSKEKNQ